LNSQNEIGEISKINLYLIFLLVLINNIIKILSLNWNLFYPGRKKCFVSDINNKNSDNYEKTKILYDGYNLCNKKERDLLQILKYILEVF